MNSTRYESDWPGLINSIDLPHITSFADEFKKSRGYRRGPDRRSRANRPAAATTRRGARSSLSESRDQHLRPHRGGAGAVRQRERRLSGAERTRWTVVSAALRWLSRTGLYPCDMEGELSGDGTLHRAPHRQESIAVGEAGERGAGIGLLVEIARIERDRRQARHSHDDPRHQRRL